MGDEPRHRDIALVLAGGGARGAYEMGALSVLLPVLQGRGEYPDIIVGTSVGGLNAAYFAATADRAQTDLPRVINEGWKLWLETEYTDVLRSLLSPPQLARFAADIGDLIGIPLLRFWSVFDPAPLAETLRKLDVIPRIHGNIGRSLQIAAVVATSAFSGRSVVFHDGGKDRIDPDPWRGIDYVKTRLTEEHVRASAAIPAAFPGQKVTTPTDWRGWYFDGGTRLNTPIKPAIEFGAKRVIVIALNSPRGPQHRPPPLLEPPDGYDGLTQIIQAVLVDPLVNDMKTLTTLNATLPKDQPKQDPKRKPRRRIGYIFVAPKPDAIGECAKTVYRNHYALPTGVLNSVSLSLLGHTLDAGKSAVRGELFSYLFFACEFARELIKLGRRDAQVWLDDTTHDEWPWRLRALPPPREHSAGEKAPPDPPIEPPLVLPECG